MPIKQSATYPGYKGVVQEPANAVPHVSKSEVDGVVELEMDQSNELETEQWLEKPNETVQRSRSDVHT